MTAGPRTVNDSPGALRRLRKAANIGMRNSAHFARAALSLVTLGNELGNGFVAPPADPHIKRRAHDLEQASRL